ncbi:uncharacterized protein B0H18DRAFT_1123309 [Fomitopsis serialis]|uniref:uncharacterized protein n=1 Tax=Fomitopsis serialis TaxID=139415 RepID=UPI0020079F02|nr:uncharacterized protein B0H18DRAFT_1123309 [Neoantrodia serialis]KAH9917944.1 hypothetical protein B0H18DRAFT_1123309 [Neoantrodia serialis]
MARQWWLGQHPEALCHENRSRFNINVKLPSSNMIALTCSAILVAFHEALAGNTTINFDEKTYATDAFAGIAHDKSQRDKGSTQEVNDGIDMQAVLGRWGKKKAPVSTVSGVQSQAAQVLYPLPPVASSSKTK